jgi:hypothetical protein
MVIGAADLPIDALTERQIGAEMRAPSTLHDRPAPSTPIGDDSGSKKIDADDGSIDDITVAFPKHRYRRSLRKAEGACEIYADRRCKVGF